MVAGLLPAGLAVRAADAVAPNDPVLIESMTQLCLRAALSSGGIDKTTRVIKIAWRGLRLPPTPDSRYQLAVQNRLIAPQP
jgi:hypothetical protein